jgi:cytochrome b6-f complex iron-sulfur subunit
MIAPASMSTNLTRPAAASQTTPSPCTVHTSVTCSATSVTGVARLWVMSRSSRRSSGPEAMVPLMHREATPDRRSVVLAAALGTTGLGALAACGSDTGSATSTAATSTAPGAGSEPESESESASPSAGGNGADAPGSLAPLSQVPVGGSVVVQAPAGKIAVAQPTAGTVVAFSAICTHQGCTVMAAGKRLECPCHGSIFDAFTGEVVQGPAQRPMGKVGVAVSGQDVVAG